MKKLSLLLLVLALLSLAACGKTEVYSPAVPTPDAPNEFAVSYIGAETDLSGLKAGDTFTWSLSMDGANSRLYAGRWLIDYPEEFVKPVGFTADGTGLADPSLWDVPAFISNLEYEGGSGDDTLGEKGNMYSLIAMYLTSFDRAGYGAEGPMFSITFEIIKLPTEKTLPMRVIVIESCAMLSPTEAVTHGSILTTDGKIFFGH